MLMKLDPLWLAFAVTGVAMLAYIFSVGLDAVKPEPGFGVVGNASIITIGFFGAIHAFNAYGTRFGSMLDATLTGLCGAFLLLFLMIALKLSLNRLL